MAHVVLVSERNTGGLALAFNDANEQATVQAHAVVTGLVQFLNSFLVPDQGKRVRSVKVGLLEGRPAITFVQCAF